MGELNEDTPATIQQHWVGNDLGLDFQQGSGLGDDSLNPGNGFAALQEFDEVSDVDQQGGHLREPSGSTSPKCGPAALSVACRY
jgi:hypothetical protein